MDDYAKVVVKIIKAQEAIVGPVAFEQAKKVKGLSFGTTEDEVKIEGDKKATLEQLLRQYEALFGRASIEVCKSAVRGIIANVPKDQLPQLLVS